MPPARTVLLTGITGFIAKRIAADLLRALAVSEAKANEAYGEVPMPRLKARFETARQKLEGMLPEDAQ